MEDNIFKNIQLTEEKLKKYIQDILLDNSIKNKRETVLYLTGYKDEEGNIICQGLEEFDKAMKEAAKNYKFEE